MKTERIVIANLKCNGCATTIKKELLRINGVSQVAVDLDNDTITLSSEGVEREVITKRLHSLGYPEATGKNGLLLQLKSYGSCVLGKVNNIK